jgi:hypothetical protein
MGSAPSGRGGKSGGKLLVVGWLLTLVGGAMAVWGIFHALAPMIETYQAALDNPLADTMPEDGKQLSREMMVHLPVGILGALMATVGSSMLMFIYGSRVLRRLSGRG